MFNQRNGLVNPEKVPANSIRERGALSPPLPINREPSLERSGTVEALAKRISELESARRMDRETVLALEKELYQLKEQIKYNRIEDSKRLAARESQTVERLKEHFQSSIRAAVEGILPRRRDRSQLPEPTRQPKNPPMPTAMQLGRVERAASAVPRLVLYGLLTIATCLAVVFAINPQALSVLIDPTETAIAVLLVAFLISCVVILLTHSES